MVILGISILFIYLFYWNIALIVQVTSVNEVPTAKLTGKSHSERMGNIFSKFLVCASSEWRIQVGTMLCNEIFSA